MIKCIFVGDVMPGAKEIKEIPSAEILDVFGAADIVVGNLESPLASKPPGNLNLSKIPLWSHADNVALLELFNFTHLGLNNNHAYDLFDEGLDETIALLRPPQILPFGITYGDICQFSVVEKGNIRIGLTAFSSIQREFSRHLSEDLRDLDLASFKETVDFLVCFVHWGNDHNIFIDRNQQQTARRLIDQGADLIIGHHPHVPQGYEVYKGKYIFYSLGNFIFTPREYYEYLPYRIRYKDHRENVLFQRLQCKIGLYIKLAFSKDGCSLLNVGPVYRPATLPVPLPQEYVAYYNTLVQAMQEQVMLSNYSKHEEEKKKIAIHYTLPLILKHPLYWPVLPLKLASKFWRTLKHLNAHSG
jgi:hypothetical protein